MSFDAGRLRVVLGRLAERRPVFHSEADFQHALAWQLHLEDPEARIRLETRPLPGRGVFLDLAAVLWRTRVALELKYLTRPLTTTIDGEVFQLRHQAAHDVRRYDVVKDIVRLEEVVVAGAADVGYAVILTNDPAYWQVGMKHNPSDAAFRIAEGVTLSGPLGWAASAGAGTTKGREPMLALTGSYPLGWADYSDEGVKGSRFRYLLVEVLPTGSGRPATQTHASEAASAPGGGNDIELAQPPGAPTGPAETRTCRESVLTAFAALERRHGRLEFSPAEVIAEAEAGGARHAPATIRTHIVSLMCVNAPANHKVRYPDLERVRPGRYRRLNP